MRTYPFLFTGLGIALAGILYAACGGPGGVAMAQAPAVGPVSASRTF